MDVGGADITDHCGLGTFTTVGVPAEIGCHVKEERRLQPLGSGLIQQLLHQLLEHLLERPLAGNIPWHPVEDAVQVDGG